MDGLRNWLILLGEVNDLRDINIIIDHRNILKNCINEILSEIANIKRNKDLTELDENSKKYIMKLYSLKEKYEDQMKGINFCLNEDSKLDNFSWFKYYDEIKQFMF